MSDTYCQLLYARLRERIEEVSKPLLSNGINTIEHYKYLSGVKIGLEDALEIAKEVYKKLYEVENLNNFSGENYESSGAKTRSFY